MLKKTCVKKKKDTYKTNTWNQIMKRKRNSSKHYKTTFSPLCKTLMNLSKLWRIEFYRCIFWLESLCHCSHTVIIPICWAASIYSQMISKNIIILMIQFYPYKVTWVGGDKTLLFSIYSFRELFSFPLASLSIYKLFYLLFAFCYQSQSPYLQNPFPALLPLPSFYPFPWNR